MPVFELRPASRPDGSFATAWFDDDACLWNDERLRSAESLKGVWVAPQLRLHRSGEGVASVLFNPNALALSEQARDELLSFPELEFLPVQIQGHGVFHVLHVAAAMELPVGSMARIAPPPSGNMKGTEPCGGPPS